MSKSYDRPSSVELKQLSALKQEQELLSLRIGKDAKPEWLVVHHYLETRISEIKGRL
jgi:hypothetical protein